MKKSRLFLSLFVFCLIAINGCKKSDMSESSKLTSEEATMKLAAGAVYTMDNATAGNNILAFSRAHDGTLMEAGSFSTGGTGTGSGLGSQGALIINDNWLFASNAGSNEVSVLKVTGKGVELLDVEASGGTMPISLTVHGNILYVLTAGGSGNISGFTVDTTGQLTPIAGSSQPLSSSSAGGAQVEFNPSGTYLVVTEKMTNMITIYPVMNGVAGAGTSYPSAGQTPFGFAFANNNLLIVSEAFGGADGLSAMSSYWLSDAGVITLVSGPVATHQTAACWVVVTNNMKYTYTTNTGSASISGYSIDNSGVIALLDANGVTGATQATPIDMALSNNSKYLYNLNSSAHSISMFMVGRDGSLASMGHVGNLPAGSVGLAAK
jgi:6-phosphogluconolactonase (cycloisomerase 2 family)